MKIGLLFSYDEDWIGGTYYVLNLVRAMESLPVAEAPELYIFCQSPEAFNYVKTHTSCQKLHPVLSRKTPWIRSFLNKLARRLTGTEWFPEKAKDIGYDFLFPVGDDHYFSRVSNKVAWIPDLQEVFFPSFFSQAELAAREAWQCSLINSRMPIVFSSQSALRDFKLRYPEALNRTIVLPFAVTLPEVDPQRIAPTQAKYSVDEPYFFCANQFWAHKNHQVVLNALAEAKRRGERVLVLFSGKQEDRRNPDFFPGLLRYIEENNLGDSVRFLGFIDREDQLLLMKGSRAVLQPSLFEGWSTVVEDCKSLGVPLILSRIAVHLEQNPHRGVYFEASDPVDLLDKMLSQPKIPSQAPGSDYRSDVELFSRRFLGLASLFRGKDGKTQDEVALPVP